MCICHQFIKDIFEVVSDNVDVDKEEAEGAGSSNVRPSDGRNQVS